MAIHIAVYILPMNTESVTHGFRKRRRELVVLTSCPEIFGSMLVFVWGLNNHMVAIRLSLDKEVSFGVGRGSQAVIQVVVD